MDRPADRVLQGRQRLRPGAGRRQGPAARGERQDRRHDRPDLLAVQRRGHRLPGQGQRRHPVHLDLRPALDNLKTAQQPVVRPGRPVLVRGLPDSASTASRRSAARRPTRSTSRTPPVASSWRASNGFEEGGGKIVSDAVRAHRRGRLQLLSHDAQRRRLHLQVDLRQRHGPFVKQYNDYGLTAPLVMAMAERPAGAGAAGARRHRYGHRRPASSTRLDVDNPLNKEFVAAVQGAVSTGELPDHGAPRR